MSRILLLISLCCTACFPAYHAMHHSSGMNVFALRLSPGQDLRKELEVFTRSNNLQAGFIITCAGSLTRAVIRPANQQIPLIREGHFEIVSLTGTLSPDGPHLHIALSDSTGYTFGGHLLDGNLVYTTAEIVTGEATSLRFTRETDPATGFKELSVKKRD
ncbi:MAG: PPC domain-containing DNA-binding protein [Bacteroidota bacterium]